jgi:hypothetical protein
MATQTDVQATRFEARRTAEPAPSLQRRTVVRSETDERPRGLLRCGACGHPITSQAARTRINGSHDHRCVNPHGFRFRIGCFESAPGCRCMGAPTLEHTWFAGCAWTYALCASCHTHLGWRFEGRDTVHFYGLMLDRLRTNDAQE